MPYFDDFWHIDAHEYILSPACLTVFVKSKTENQLIRYVIAYFSRQQRKIWNSCCNARTQTSSLQAYGLLTVLTLILWITGYVEYCSNVFNRKSVKNWTLMNWAASDWSVAWHPAKYRWSGNWPMGVHFNACVKAKRKHIGNMLWCAVPQLLIICYETYITVIFCFTNFNQSWLFEVLALVVEQFLARLLNFVL